MAEFTEMEMVEKYQQFSFHLDDGSFMLSPLNNEDSELIKTMMRVGTLYFLEESGFISTRMLLVLLDFETKQFEIVQSLYEEERK